MFASLLIGIAFASKQQPNVSLELRGVRLENAAPILAKTFGLDSLEIGPSLKNEVLLVRTKDVDPDVLRANLAKVLNGSWVHRPEGWWLGQSDIQKDTDKKTYDELRYKYFSELVAKSKKKLAVVKPLDEAECKRLLKEIKAIASVPQSRFNNYYARYKKIDEQGPFSRLAFRIAQRITPDVWMKLTDQAPRIVFSTRPNQMQQPFPVRIDDLLNLVNQEQNTWATFAGGEPLQSSSDGGDMNIRYYLGQMNEHRQPLSSQDINIFTMSLNLTNQSIEFASYDAKGKRVISTNISGYDNSDIELELNIQDEIQKIQKRMVKVTGDAAEYLNLFSSENIMEQVRGSRKPLSESLKAKILHPETIDPLSIAAPEVYLKSIETPNVVMVMSDSQRISRFAEFRDPRFVQFNPMVVSEKDGWFLAPQSNPLMNRKMMPERKRLGQILRFMNENNRSLTLEEQAKLAMDLPWETDVTDRYRDHMSVLQTKEIESYNSRSGLRIYGSMNGGERDRAKKRAFPLSVLNDTVKQEIFRSLFYSQRNDAQAQLDWSASGKMTSKEVERMMAMQNLFYGGIYEEKTFLLPNGLTNSLLISIEDQSTDLLYCDRPLGGGDMSYGQGVTMSASQLGGYLFHLTNPTKYRWAVQDYNRIDENQIHLTTRRQLVIKLRLSSEVFVSWNLMQTLIADPATYTSKTLPDRVKAEVKKGYDEAEKSDQYYGIPNSQSKKNPPPR